MKTFTSLLPILASSLLITSATAKVQFAGVNIAGCDFGCDSSGTCGGRNCPTGNGPDQMSHFVKDDGLNVFRLPVGWQYLVAHDYTAPIDQTFFAEYDIVVQGCLATGAHCIIDIHNYARWNGTIIGQPGPDQTGPSNDDFVSLWLQLAKAYASQPNVMFGLMNEPHDLDINMWGETLQAVVTGIRNAGAVDQLILLSGTNSGALGGFDSFSGPALAKIVDIDGSTNKLIFEVHTYLDEDSSGGHPECVRDQVDNLGYQANWLRSVGRQMFLTETGGGNTDSCVQYLCQELQYMNDNSDVYLGWVGWAAGNLDTQSVLSEVPNKSTDTLLVDKCIAGKFR